MLSIVPICVPDTQLLRGRHLTLCTLMFLCLVLGLTEISDWNDSQLNPEGSEEVMQVKAGQQETLGKGNNLKNAGMLRLKCVFTSFIPTP